MVFDILFVILATYHSCHIQSLMLSDYATYKLYNHSKKHSNPQQKKPYSQNLSYFYK